MLLYADSGAPVDLLTGPDDIDRRVLGTANGLRLYNSFPIRCFDPGTRNVGRPTLGPAVTIPEVTTPELQQP